MCCEFRIFSLFVFIVPVVFLNVITDTIAFAGDLVVANAVVVEGEVIFFSPNSSLRRVVEVNTTFVEGDRVITAKDSKIEFVFDAGDMILLDSNSDMTILSLRRDKQGVLSAIFYLGLGILKSSFLKKNDDDLVEYHTKTAIAGIAGTPEHIIQADFSEENIDRTRVYLFGDEGDEGSLYVRGFDPDKTEVNLLPGHGTTILAGLGPSVPLILAPEIIKLFSHVIFSASGAATGAVAGSVASAGAVSTAGAATTGAAVATASATGISAGTVAVVGGGAVAAGAAVASSGGGSDDGEKAAFTVEIEIPEEDASRTGQNRASDENAGGNGWSLRDYCRSQGWLTCYHDLADDARERATGEEGACCKSFEPCTMYVDLTGHPFFDNRQQTGCPNYDSDSGSSCVVCEW